MIIAKIKGFTLIEMAIVLVIVGLLVASLVAPLQAQRDIRHYQETRQLLRESKEALIGYTLINRHLPCPDKAAGADNGLNDRPNDGVEDFDVAGNCIVAEGNLPWATLAVFDRDAWGQALIYRVTAAFSQRAPLNTFALATPGVIRICNEAACNVPRLTDSAVAVMVSRGKNQGVCGTLPSPPACADERANDDGINNDFVSHELILNANAEYDDVVLWLSSNVLMNRMVAAGQLP